MRSFRPGQLDKYDILPHRFCPSLLLQLLPLCSQSPAVPQDMLHRFFLPTAHIRTGLDQDLQSRSDTRSIVIPRSLRLGQNSRFRF